MVSSGPSMSSMARPCTADQARNSAPGRRSTGQHAGFDHPVQRGPEQLERIQAAVPGARRCRPGSARRGPRTRFGTSPFPRARIADSRCRRRAGWRARSRRAAGRGAAWRARSPSRRPAPTRRLHARPATARHGSRNVDTPRSAPRPRAAWLHAARSHRGPRRAPARCRRPAAPYADRRGDTCCARAGWRSCPWLPPSWPPMWTASIISAMVLWTVYTSGVCAFSATAARAFRRRSSWRRAVADDHDDG